MERKKVLVAALKVLKVVISSAMIHKVAASGLGMCSMHLAFARGGCTGLADVLKERSDGKARVTSNGIVIDNTSSFLQKE